MSVREARPDGARSPRVDPSGRPLHNRRRQGAQALGIVFAWIGLMVLLFWAAGDGPGKTRVVIPWLFVAGLAGWLLAEKEVGKHGLIWPGSALGVVGPLSVGLAMNVLTPDMRLAPPEEQIAVVSGTSAFLMALFVWRFRLPGLILPMVTFTIVALFLGLYGIDPERLREVEGFSPRGILAAMIQSTAWVMAFAATSGAAVVLARWLDLNGDDFGLAAARPLHVIGAGVFPLVIGRWLGLLPAPLDIIALTLAWGAGILWALKINRIAVMFATQLAMTRLVVLAVAAPLGYSLDRQDWATFITVMMFSGMAYWPLLHEQSLRRGWTLGPGRRIPQPRNNWWRRYWPYA